MLNSQFSHDIISDFLWDLYDSWKKLEIQESKKWLA